MQPVTAIKREAGILTRQPAPGLSQYASEKPSVKKVIAIIGKNPISLLQMIIIVIWFYIYLE
ncbi:hypothetical protein [Endozoicomonas lisbonensis]|uniref:Uncharacterized protein n=1 Tax=Endozoicomonas lisbonensis TaxID=3120522 RepID=A0ABV2SIQ0_9GAMM